tara:strand:+ start:235 stop:954 length:720 start_codon:yes stop_codon:yes gene_type:complete
MSDETANIATSASVTPDSGTSTPENTSSSATGGTPEKGVSSDELVNALRYMFKEVQTLKGNIDTMQGNMNSQVAPPARPETAEPTPFTSVDVEMLDNKGLVEYIDNRLNQQLQPLTDGIQSLNNATTRSEVEEQVGNLRNDKTAHFDAFVNEVREVMEQKGGAISVEEALVLAKSKDPDKVGRLNEEISKESSAKPNPFVGLLPTSGKSTRSTRMEGKEAASAAWEELGLDDIIKELPN